MTVWPGYREGPTSYRQLRIRSGPSRREHGGRALNGSLWLVFRKLKAKMRVNVHESATSWALENIGSTRKGKQRWSALKGWEVERLRGCQVDEQWQSRGK